MTQLTLNVKVSSITKVTSFFANFGRESNLFGRPRNQISIEATIKKGNLIRTLRDNISKMQEGSTTYQNKKRKTIPLLKKKNKIYLFTKNLKINKKRSKKLDHTKVESFFVKVVKGRVNYELNLLIDAKIFSIFHVFVLESTHSNTSIQITFRYQTQEDQKYEVERILRQQGQQYLIKWKEYPTSKNTWEPLRNLKNCTELLRRYHQHQSSSWSNPEKPKRWGKQSREHSQSSNR